MILLEIFRVVSRFPATFYVISQKVDFLWDSVYIMYTTTIKYKKWTV